MPAIARLVRRYPYLDLHDRYLNIERERLAHARAHADCYVLTDGLTPDEVSALVVERLTKLGLPPQVEEYDVVRIQPQT